jgi:hypothetical protein
MHNRKSILLIDEIGFDNPTSSKKAAKERIGSNESSLYRYLKNKHKLLLLVYRLVLGWFGIQVGFCYQTL